MVLKTDGSKSQRFFIKKTVFKSGLINGLRNFGFFK